MTKEEFIGKWNVAYEDKEQEIEFAIEMKADLDSIVESPHKQNDGCDHDFQPHEHPEVYDYDQCTKCGEIR
jgi:hypothetical protein